MKATRIVKIEDKYIPQRRVSLFLWTKWFRKDFRTKSSMTANTIEDAQKWIDEKGWMKDSYFEWKKLFDKEYSK